MKAVAARPKAIAPESETIDIELRRSSTPRGSSTGSSLNKSRSFGSTPAARSARRTPTTEDCSRYSPTTYISVLVLRRVRLVFPDRDDREQLGEDHVEHNHGGKSCGGYGDLDPGGRIRAGCGRQARIGQRGHDDQVALQPHADEHAN